MDHATRRCSCRRATALAAIVCLGALVRSAGADDLGGVLVERVAAGREAARVGLKPGDVVRGWTQGDASGSVEAPFDLVTVQVERAPLRPVGLACVRDGRALLVTLESDDWGLFTRPQLDPELRQLLSSVTAIVQRDRNPERDLPFLEVAAQRVRSDPAPAAARIFLLSVIGAVQARLGRVAAMEATLAQAIALARAARPSDERFLHASRARCLWELGRIESALAAGRDILAGSSELASAHDLADLANLALESPQARGAGLAAIQKAVAIFERLAPHSAAFSDALAIRSQYLEPAEQLPDLERALAVREGLPASGPLATLLYEVGRRVAPWEPTRALACARRAAEIEEQQLPGSLDLATSLTLLTSALADVGDLDEAERTERRALAIRERLAPNSLFVADSETRLGTLLLERGDFAEAEALHQRAMPILEREAPGTVLLARKFQNLAELFRVQGDTARAAAYLKQALSIFEAGDGPPELLAAGLAALGSLASDLGDAKEAESDYRRALELIAGRGSEASLLSVLRQNLGGLLADQGRLDEAESLYKEALAADAAREDRGWGTAGRRLALGRLALRRKDWDGAQRQLESALAVFQALAPGSLMEADALHSLADAADGRGAKEEAVSYLRRAVTALETQSLRLGGSPELRARFRASHASLYRELEEKLLELKRSEEAFHVTERARARALLAQMADRKLRFSQGATDLERERRSADADYDRLFARLREPGPAHDDALQRELDAARRKQDDVRARLRAASPRAASFRDPEPLDLPAARRVLARGTLLLSYRVGPDASRVYAVGPGEGEFAVLDLGVDEATLRADVRALREMIEARRGPALQAGLFDRSRRLSRRLLGPVADKLARAERLLIVPDGVLHLLPFATLADPTSTAKQRFLIEAKALHVVSSVTLYAELVRPAAGPRSAPRDVVAFGDPVYPRSKPRASPTLEAAVRRGLEFQPLPWSRREVDALRRLSPATTRVWLGAEATESRAKALADGLRILHFACHGFTDDTFPLESGLALSIPEQMGPGDDNGLLQAWEIFEGKPLDADLVTLSACRTGAGKELAGEGLLGLVWAFEYAGARSVLASLWEVNDASTAELMGRFYRALAGGASKAEALRQAQIALIRHPSRSAPYLWAAFQLIGDGH